MRLSKKSTNVPRRGKIIICSTRLCAFCYFMLHAKLLTSSSTIYIKYIYLKVKVVIWPCWYYEPHILVVNTPVTYRALCKKMFTFQIDEGGYPPFTASNMGPIKVIQVVWLPNKYCKIVCIRFFEEIQYLRSPNGSRRAKKTWLVL